MRPPRRGTSPATVARAMRPPAASVRADLLPCRRAKPRLGYGGFRRGAHSRDRASTRVNLAGLGLHVSAAVLVRNAACYHLVGHQTTLNVESSGALGGSNMCGEQRGKSRGLATRHSTLGADPVHTRVPPGDCEAGQIACCIVIVD